tara:strand:- start:514 stop:1161 length:648 start_codon:yes stop_codon:yes gene_type:complete
MILQILTSKSSYVQKNKDNFIKLFNKNVKIQFINNSKYIKKKADLIIVISHYKKIPLNNLKINKNIFVIHESNLPNGRGMSPLFNQILNGEEKIVSTVFRCAKNFDDGPVIFKKKFHYPGNLVYEEIKALQMKNSISLIKRIINLLNKNELSSIKQIGKSSYFKKISSKINELNIDKSIKSQINILRTRDKKKFRGYFFYKKRKFYLSMIPEKKV